MKDILTYPLNEPTDYIDPLYIGDANSGLQKRMQNFIDGNYLPWQGVAPINDVDMQMQDLSKFKNYYLNLPFETDENMTFWDFSQNTQLLSDVVLQSYPLASATSTIQILGYRLTGPDYGKLSLSIQQSNGYRYGFYDGTKIELLNWEIQDATANPDLWAKRVPDDVINPGPQANDIFLMTNSDATDHLMVTNTTLNSWKGSFTRKNVVIASQVGNDITYTNEGDDVLTLEFVNPHGFTNSSQQRYANGFPLNATDATNPVNLGTNPSNGNFWNWTHEVVDADTVNLYFGSDFNATPWNTSYDSNNLLTGSMLNQNYPSYTPDTVSRINDWGRDDDPVAVAKYNQLKAWQDDNGLLRCRVRVGGDTNVWQTTTPGFPVNDYNYFIDAWCTVGRVEVVSPPGLPYTYSYFSYVYSDEAGTLANVMEIDLQNGVAGATAEILIIPNSAGDGWYTDAAYFGSLANMTKDKVQDPTVAVAATVAGNAHNHMIDSMDLNIPSNRIWNYQDVNGDYVYNNDAVNLGTKYWIPGETFNNSWTAQGEVKPYSAFTLSTTGLLGLIESVGWDPEYPGQLDGWGSERLYELDYHPSEYFPVPQTPAQQQDNWDTADQWTTTRYDPGKVWPTIVTPMSASINLKTPSTVNNSQNGIKYTRASGFSKWTLDVEYPPMTADEFREFHGIAQAANGQATPFYFVLQNADGNSILWKDFYTLGTTQTVRLKEPTEVGDTTMLLEGFDTFETSAFQTGEVFVGKQNDNGALHTVVNTVQSNAYGEAKIRTAMPNKESAAIASQIYKNPYWAVVTLSADDFAYSIDTAGFYNMSVSFDLDRFVDDGGL